MTTTRSITVRTSRRLRLAQRLRLRLRPRVEGMEDRLVLSTATAVPAQVGPLATPTPTPQISSVNVLDQLHINQVVNQNGQLTAVGTLGSHPFSAPLTLSATPNPADPSCPILNLHLGEIHLNLLGLKVDTSQICLSVTAHQGGGLLGDLLCNVSNLLNNGTSLSTILNGLGSNLTTVLNGLSGLLNGALGAATTTAAPNTVSGVATPSVSGTTAGACDILNLSLAPIDLTLLGLNVHLDNCSGGPVTVNVTAVPSGGLLGQLLCSVDDLLSNGHASNTAINRLLTNVANTIDTLI